MTDDRIAALLASAAVPDATAARDATVTAALAAIGEPAPERATTAGAASTPRRRLLPRVARHGWALAALALALLTVAAVSPPGRAALASAADLIGKIGGAPASDGDAGLESTVPPGQPGSPTVVDTGEAPDGSRDEWVAYRREEPDGFKTFCVRFAWVGQPLRKATGGCGSLGGGLDPGLPGPTPLVGLSGRITKPSAGGGRAGGDYLMVGRAAMRVARVRILYRRPNGERVDVPVDLGRVRGELLRRAGGERPFTVLTAFIPRDLLRADRLGERYRLMSLTLEAPGYRFRPPYSTRYRRCVNRHGGFRQRGWIDVYAYDRAGREIQALRSSTMRPPPPACEPLRRLPPPKVFRMLVPASNPPPEPPPPPPAAPPD